MKKKAFLGLFVCVALVLVAVGASLAGEGRTPAKKDGPAGGEAEPLVRVQEAEAVLSGYAEYDEFVADTTEPQVRVAFLAEGDVREFKVLSLHLKDVDSNGKADFLVDTLYALDRLKPERPLVVTLTFYGSTPHHGISYLDSKGKTRYFTLGESGMDGSLELTEF